MYMICIAQILKYVFEFLTYSCNHNELAHVTHGDYLVYIYNSKCPTDVPAVIELHRVEAWVSLGSTTHMYSVSVWWGVWCAWLLNTDFWSLKKSPCWFIFSNYILMYVDMDFILLCVCVLVIFLFVFEFCVYCPFVCLEMQCWFVYVTYKLESLVNM